MMQMDATFWRKYQQEHLSKSMLAFGFLVRSLALKLIGFYSEMKLKYRNDTQFYVAFHNKISL